ncbi:MAG: DinB family protein [Ferruginibacter sp.]
MPKPLASTPPSYFQRYIDQVLEDDLHTAFNSQLPIITPFLLGITEEKSNYAYGSDKWTIKELLLHITDTERIFAYRSLCFARNEKASLPGFDENEFAANSNANNRSWQSLVDEFLLVRKNTETMFNSFTENALNNMGIANNKPSSALMMGFTAIGHVYHHKKIIEERYL